MIEDLLRPQHVLLLMIIGGMMGLIPAAVAQSKGRSFFVWWVYGAALFIVALPHALMVKTDLKAIEAARLKAGDSRKCPFCAEITKREAVVCRYCGRDLPAVTFDSGEAAGRST